MWGLPQFLRRQELPRQFLPRTEERLAARLIELLTEKRLSIALAESCTGGLLGSLLACVPGASNVFWGGFVTYTLDAKRRILGIDGELLEKYGAVSRECAASMAEAARGLANTDMALSVTGFAGPGGGSPGNPVGTVWIAFSRRNGETLTAAHRFTGGRNRVRAAAAAAAIKIALDTAGNL